MSSEYASPVEPVRYGKYTLLERLGAGGMAEVYLARQEGAGGFAKKVVIKRILAEYANDPTFTQMFMAEAQLAAHLTHPNIVQIFDMGQEENTLFIAMEYVAGPNLLTLLRYAIEGNEMRREPFVKILSGVAEGLHYAHNAAGPDGEPLRIVHRDINPPNIMVSVEGVPKVCDFGVAKSASRETTTGVNVKGKYTYMAPEQIRGESVDARADIFSLGVVLFESTTGKRLFKRGSDLAVLNAVLSDPIPRPSQIIADYPERLDEIVMWCLERDRDRRCPDARTLHDSLEEYLRSEPGGGMSQVALGEWVRQVVPPEARGGLGTQLSAHSRTPTSQPKPKLWTHAGQPSKSGAGATPIGTISRPGGTRPPTNPSALESAVGEGSASRSRPGSSPGALPAIGSGLLGGAEASVAGRAGGLPLKWIIPAAAVVVGVIAVVLLTRHPSADVPAQVPAAAATQAAATPPAPAPPSPEESARIYVEEARRLLGLGKFGPAAALVDKAKALNPQAPQTNVAIAELEDEAEVGARLAAARQALADKDLARATSLAKLVLDKEPSQAEALELLRKAHGAPAPTFAPRTDSLGVIRVDAPPGARVYVDDEPIGQAPITRYPVAAGRHRVEVRREGFKPELFELAVRARKTSQVTAHMSSAEKVHLALQEPAAAEPVAPSAPAPAGQVKLASTRAMPGRAAVVAAATPAPGSAPPTAPTPVPDPVTAPTPAAPPAPAPVTYRNVPEFAVQRDVIRQSPPRLSEVFKQSHRSDKLAGSYKLCLDATGHVAQVTVVQSIPGADDSVIETMKSDWLYKAQASPVCFIHQVQIAVK